MQVQTQYVLNVFVPFRNLYGSEMEDLPSSLFHLGDFSPGAGHVRNRRSGTM